MATLPETPEWIAAIYQLEEDDLVKGGADGIDNLQAKQLAARTKYLKQQVESALSDMTAHLAAVDPPPSLVVRWGDWVGRAAALALAAWVARAGLRALARRRRPGVEQRVVLLTPGWRLAGAALQAVRQFSARTATLSSPGIGWPSTGLKA